MSIGTSIPDAFFDEESRERMSRDLYHIIPHFCNEVQVRGFRKRIVLADDSQIEYLGTRIEDLDRFVAIFRRHIEAIGYLGSHLTFDSKTQSVETQRQRVGEISIPLTARSNRNDPSNSQQLVCVVPTKRLDVPENELLVLILAAAISVCQGFRSERNELLGYSDKHDQVLDSVQTFCERVLQDRRLRKMLHVALDHDFSSLVFELEKRAIERKLKSEYYPLMRILGEYARYIWLLNDETPSLLNALQTRLGVLVEEKVYEMWVFYKILECLQLRLVQEGTNPRIFRSIDDPRLSIHYQQGKEIDWTRVLVDGKRQLFRIPDVTMRYGNEDVAYIDAKCVDYSSEDADDRGRPTSGVINQMLVYLTHGKRCNTGILLFGKPKTSKIWDKYLDRKAESGIICASVHPGFEDSLERVRKTLTDSLLSVGMRI